MFKTVKNCHKMMTVHCVRVQSKILLMGLLLLSLETTRAIIITVVVVAHMQSWQCPKFYSPPSAGNNRFAKKSSYTLSKLNICFNFSFFRKSFTNANLLWYNKFTVFL